MAGRIFYTMANWQRHTHKWSRYTILTLLVLGVTSCSKLMPPDSKGGASAKTGDKSSYVISIGSGDSQSGSAGSKLSNGLVAHVTSDGSAVVDANVSWSATGGTFQNKFTTTDPAGNAPTDFVLGSTPGANAVTATLDNGKSVTFHLTSLLGPASILNSNITGTGPIEPDGINSSSIKIALLDSQGNAIVGITPTFTATGSGNLYGACSASDSLGVSTCSLRSTVGETKILSITSPVSKVGGTVVFQPGAASALHSTISGTTPVTANGVSTSAITITLKDASNAPVGGVVPTFIATDTGSTNVYSACSSSSAVTGISTCTLKSTHAESKTLSLVSPSVTGNVVVFNPGAASTTTSTITGTGPIEPDGASTSSITVTLLDANSNPISGTTPVFTASGSNNTVNACSATNASGISTCTLSSTKAETKTLSITSPIAKSGGTVVFQPSAVSALHTTISGTTPVIADGVATSTVTITLKDASNVVVGGVTPAFTATDTGSTNAYGACSASNATTGVSTCTFSSTHAEAKTLTLSSPVSATGNVVTFSSGSPSATTSTITGVSSITANGTSTSAITITLLDAHSNPVSGVIPTFSATDTGSTNHYNVCSATSAAGVSTCTMTSTKAETKTLSIATPVTVSGGTITFVHGSASTITSTIAGTSPVEPDGVASSNITITLLDQYGNGVNGTTPTFSATDTGSTNAYGVCSSSSTSGVSSCTLSSTHPEIKTLSLVSPVSLTGGTVTFVSGSASSLHSTITGTTSVTANGTSTSTVTVVLKDSSNIAVVGVTPTFNATDTGGTNAYGACSSSDATGTSTCSFSSKKAEAKTLTLTSPISMSGGSVTFVHGTPSTSTSLITGTGSVQANGTATSTVTIVLYDAYNNPVDTVTPTFSATDTGGVNVYGACSATNATGSSTCTLASSHAETKVLSIASPVVVTGGSVVFTGGVVSASTSTITGTAATADGTSSSTITITLEDASGNPVSGTVPTFSATNTGATNAYGVCSSSNASGVSTCTLKSTKAETKTLQLTGPVSVTGGIVVFSASTASAAKCSITGTGPVSADGVSSGTVTITLKDSNNNLISGAVPTFTATDTGTTNVYGTCSSTNTSGISTCSLKSTKAETKTLSIASPVVKTGGTVTFGQVASTSNSSIIGTGPVSADGTTTASITITLKDYSNVAIVGVTPTFSATNSGSTNSYGGCSATNSSGISTCTLSSAKAETKTLAISSPISMNGGTVTFSQAISATNSGITGTGSVAADGTSSSTITITLKDYANAGVSGLTPTFSATDTGSTNTYGSCSSTDASGNSVCTLKSTHAETKTLSISTPVVVTGGTVSFTQAVSTSNSTITGSGPVAADGASSSTVTITLKDYSNTGISGLTPSFSATDTNGLNTYGSCSSTNSSGISTCTLQSTQSESKTLALTSPVSVTGGSVTFTQVVSPTYSTISGSGPVTADGVSSSSVTIYLKDYANTAIVGVVPTFNATDTGSTNVYGVCSSSASGTGASTCTLQSTQAETKTLQLLTPVGVTGGDVVFQ